MSSFDKVHVLGVDLPYKDESPTVVKNLIWKALLNPYVTIDSLIKILKRLQAPGSSQYILQNLEDAEKEFDYNALTDDELRLMETKMFFFKVSEEDRRNSPLKIKKNDTLRLEPSDWAYLLHQIPQLVDNNIISHVLDEISPQIIASFVNNTVKGHKAEVEDIAQYFYEWNNYYNYLCDKKLLSDPEIQPKPICLMIGKGGIGKSLILEESAKILNADLITIDCLNILENQSFEDVIDFSLEQYFGEDIIFKSECRVKDNQEMITNNRKVIWHFENFEHIAHRQNFFIGFKWFLQEKFFECPALGTVEDCDTMNVSATAIVLTANFDYVTNVEHKLPVYKIVNLLEQNDIHDSILENLSDIIQLKALTKEDVFEILDDLDEPPMNFFRNYYAENNKRFFLTQEQKNIIAENALKVNPGIHMLHIIIAEVLRDEMLQIANK